MLGDPPVANAHRIDGFEVDGAAGQFKAKEWATVGAVVDLVGRHQVALDGLLVDLGMEVGEGGPQSLV